MDDGHDAALPVVLVVEDNPDVRAYLRDHLRARYAVRVARDGDEGLQKARAQPPDLIISDVMMPMVDGVGLCRAVRADDSLSDIPVILLTARAGETERVCGLEAGADDYVEKPFEIGEVLARIDNLIENRRRLRARYSREIVVSPTDVVMAAEDETFYEKVHHVVEEHIADNTFGVSQLAQEMNMSTSTLSRKLKGTTGLTPAVFVRRMRLERAAQLLRADADLHVYRVADGVGYRDAGHFARLFREHFGVAPSAYGEGERAAP